MAQETVDPASKTKSSVAEAKTEAAAKQVPLTEVEGVEGDLPSRKDANLLPQEDNDPNEGWTNQAAEFDGRTFVERDAIPGQYVDKSELPTKEGLEDIGVVDADSYLAGVPVKA